MSVYRILMIIDYLGNLDLTFRKLVDGLFNREPKIQESTKHKNKEVDIFTSFINRLI